MSEDIVVQLCGWSEGSSDDSRRMVWLMRQSADTIEALRAENARLKGALESICAIAYDHGSIAAIAHARKALAGETT